jgi:hypothetical protein
MSAKHIRPDVEIILNACNDYIDRAMAAGFTKREAWRMLDKLIFEELDLSARERRSRFKVIQGEGKAGEIILDPPISVAPIQKRGPST